MEPYKKWTAKEDARLRALHPDHSNRDIAALMERSESAVKNRARLLALRKSGQHIAANGGRFRKGRVSHNKGRKRSEYMSPEGRRRAQALQWKKGNIPHNTLEVGTIKAFGSYLHVKTDYPGRWMPLHHLVWQVYTRGWFERDGIPDGYCVQFRDGNPENCRFDNLRMVRRDDQMRQNAGSLNLPDSMIAAWLGGGGKQNRETKAFFLQNKPLLEAKRNLILLNRAIRSKTN
jgi:hypothetical protein